MAKEKETSNLFEYTEESIKSLDWKEHIRLRPGMYIGKLGDGSSPDDGIYVLVKEVIDNCIDEYTMGYGKTVELTIEGKEVTIRDFDFRTRPDTPLFAEARWVSASWFNAATIS